jgi:hypothetical protein
MDNEWIFEDENAFVEKLKELNRDGVTEDSIETVTPYHVHRADRFIKSKPSSLKFFTLAGSLMGLAGGFGLTIFTVLSWPLITGGKPIISITAFIVIAFELTILIGAIVTFLGFLVLGKLPDIGTIQSPEESGNNFIIRRIQGERS